MPELHRQVFLERALPLSHLQELAEDFDLSGFLRKSKTGRRAVFIPRAATAASDLTRFRDGKVPEPAMMRDQVAVGLLSCIDFKEYIRAQFGLIGAEVLRDEARSKDLALALAGTIVATFLAEEGVESAS